MNPVVTSAMTELGDARRLAEALAQKLAFLDDALPNLINQVSPGAGEVLHDAAADAAQLVDHVEMTAGLAGRASAPEVPAKPARLSVLKPAFEDVRDGLTRAMVKTEFLARVLAAETDSGLKAIIADLAGDLDVVLGDLERSAPDLPA